MYQATALLIIFFSSAYGDFGCPDKDVLAPCYCSMNHITCDEELTSDQLKQVFQRISDESTELHFSHLSLRDNYNLTELRANTFADVTFDWIDVMICPNLVDVHEDAFKGTEALTTNIGFYSTGIGRSKTRTIFDILNKFVNAREISLYDNGHENTTIPSGAFANLKSLNQFNVQNEQFSRIASNAFNVDNIFVFKLHWTNISVIEDNAFYSKKTGDNNFILNLMDNRLLSGDSFAEKAFSNIAKPTQLLLGHFANDLDYWKTPITYLNEKTFLPFLSSGKNKLTLSEYGYHLDCNDCRNAWLKNHPEALEHLSSGSYPSDLKCANNKNLDDPINFVNCTSSYY